MPADAEAAPSPGWPGLRRLGCLAAFAVVCAVSCLLNSPMLVIRPALELALGWIPFLRDVGGKVTVNPAAVGMSALCLGLFLGGAHWFGGWLWPALRPDGGPWRGRWTGALGGLVVVAFAAGTAAVGVVHQVSWLATSPEPLIESSWGGRGDFETRLAESALRELAGAQARRAQERPGASFSTLAELAAEGAVQASFAAGEVHGHGLEACPSLVEPERRWFATATPLAPGPRARWLFVNHEGVVFFTTAGPFAVDRASCEVPPGLAPLGR